MFKLFGKDFLEPFVLAKVLERIVELGGPFFFSDAFNKFLEKLIWKIFCFFHELWSEIRIIAQGKGGKFDDWVNKLLLFEAFSYFFKINISFDLLNEEIFIFIKRNLYMF